MKISTFKIFSYLTLLRPKQWIKNAFILAPLLFTGQFFVASEAAKAVIATILFCVASSSSYIVNDIHDLKNDRHHPIKSIKRPLAAGVIAATDAIVILLILYSTLLIGFVFFPRVVAVIIIYVLINIAYTYVLKNIPVVDIFSIATGFVLRVVTGAVALDVPVSDWMLVTTLCLALYLAAVKRRQELSQFGIEGRKVLRKYSVALVDRYAEMSATAALVFYSMFVMSESPQLVLTVPLVLFGLFRYWYVVEVLEGGESPTDALLADLPLMLTVFVWIVACGWVLRPIDGM